MILDEILRHKKAELRLSEKTRPFPVLRKKVGALPRRKNRFLSALKKARGMAVIAEIKRRSPSKGLLRKNFDPVKIALDYQRAGAAALSVLTDHKYFGGSTRILETVRKSCSLPILRKDFILEEYQVYESRLMKADAILLIVRALDAGRLGRLHATAKKLGLETLFEVHDAADLKKALFLKPRLIGINNRDLASFRVDLGVTGRLAPKVPKRCVLVSESGISLPEHVSRLKKDGVRAVLVGEAFMREKSPGAALKRLLGNRHGSR